MSNENNGILEWEMVSSERHKAQLGALSEQEFNELKESGVTLYYVMPDDYIDAEIESQDDLDMLSEEGNILYYIEREVKWTQPILVMQNKYFSSLINKWDGQSLVLDEDTGSILSQRLAAGRKENDNTFSGVLIGDWEQHVQNIGGSGEAGTTIQTNTGLYGFDHGAMTYGFMDNGTAFLGASGGGRILFNGNTSQITSESYTANGQGILIDLNDSLIKIGNADYYIDNESDRDAIGITLKSNFGDDVDLKSINDKNIDDIKALVAQNKVFYKKEEDSDKVELVKSNNIIESNKNYYYILPDNDYPLTIGRNFKVGWDGSISAKYGIIEGSEFIGGRFAEPESNDPNNHQDYINFDYNGNSKFSLGNGSIVYDGNKVKISNGVSITWNDSGEEQDKSLQDYIDSLTGEQIDGLTQTWYQAEDPSMEWTITDLTNSNNNEKAKHIGDLWHYSGETGEVYGIYRVKNSEWIWKQKDGKYQWEAISVSDEVFDLIDGKSTIFTSKPTLPYYQRDAWIISQGDMEDASLGLSNYQFIVSGEENVEVKVTKGDILTCVTSSAENQTEIDLNHWQKAVKYTDDSLASDAQALGEKLVNGLGFQETEITGEYIISPCIVGGFLNITTGDKKRQVIIDPSYTSQEGEDKKYIFYISNKEKYPDSPIVSIDKDGNAIFTGTINAEAGKFEGLVQGGLIRSNETYGNNNDPTTSIDLNTGYFSFGNGSIVYDDKGIKLKNVTIDWNSSSAPSIDLSSIEDAIDNLQQDMEQLDGRIQTYSQETNPKDDWNVDEYLDHTGDLWVDPKSNLTKRWNGSSWETVTDSDLLALAKTKAQIFTGQPQQPPTPPYKIGDLWVQGKEYDILYCIKNRDSGSYVSTDWEKASKYTDDTGLEKVKDDIISLSGSLNTTNGNINTLNDKVSDYLGLEGKGLQGENFIIYPYIAGGYLNITNSNNDRVIIDPKLKSNEKYIFQVQNKGNTTVGIDKDGNASFKGTIIAPKFQAESENEDTYSQFTKDSLVFYLDKAEKMSLFYGEDEYYKEQGVENTSLVSLRLGSTSNNSNYMSVFKRYVPKTEGVVNDTVNHMWIGDKNQTAGILFDLDTKVCTIYASEIKTVKT